MSKNITIEPTNKNNQVNILDDVHSLGLISISPGIVEAFKAIWGPEGRKDIWIKNKLTKRIKVQFIDGKNVSETVDSESAVMFNKCPRDGFLGTKTYQCRVTSESKHAQFYCYGERAPRRDNRFEVREDGIYLIDEAGEHRVGGWESDEVDHPGQHHHADSKSGNNKINFLLF